MKTSFKVECFREQRLGTVLYPCKSSNYSYAKIIFSVVSENQNIDIVIKCQD